MFSRQERQQRRVGGRGMESGSSGEAYSPDQSNEYDAFLEGGGNYDLGQILMAIRNNQNWGGGGGGGNDRLAEWLMAQPAPERASEFIRTKAQLADPEKYAREQYMAQQYTAPFAEGGVFQGRRAADVMTPEQILASQGNTAANQWAQMGGVKNINPATLQDLNAKIARQRAGSYRSYV